MYLSGQNNNISRPDQRKIRTKNDIVYTDPDFAERMVNYFSPQFQPNDRFLEPCAGINSIYNALPNNKAWCEIERGRDFLKYTPKKKINWTITNFPWSGKAYRPLYRRACELSDNVVHLIRAHNIMGTTARHRDYLDYNHRLKEIILVDWKEAFINKAPEGFALIIVHTQKDYKGDCKWTYNLP